MLKRELILIAIFYSAFPIPHSALGQTPLGTDFTYQGRLSASGLPAVTSADFQFALFDAQTGGAQTGSTLFKENVALSGGVFTVSLDFGAAAFNGTARWLEVGVRSPAGSGGFTTLAPRQPLTAAPYSLQTRGIAVDASGRVGIGTTVPLAGLHVRKEPANAGGTLALEGATHSYLSFFPDGAGAGRRGFFGFALPATPDLLIANEAPNGLIWLSDATGIHLPAAGLENFRIICGNVGGNGDIESGVGFTVNRTEEGHYIINYSVDFAQVPAVTATVRPPFGADSCFAENLATNVNSCHIQVVRRSDGDVVDRGFGFIAIGPR